MPERAGVTTDRQGRTRSRWRRWVLAGLVCVAVGVVVRYVLLDKTHLPTRMSAVRRQGLNAPFITSPDLVVEQMVELARLTPNDLVYDLGCGDGRIVITAALKTGCRGVGFDIDPQRVAEARANVQVHNVEDRVQIVEQDLFTVDLRQADVAMMYLLPWMMNKLLPQLEQMKPGCRIVSFEFWIDGIMPENIVETPAADGHIQRIYLYTTPLTKNPALEPGKPPVPSDLPATNAIP